MRDISIWAPNAKRIQAKVDDATFPMTPQPGGYWHTVVESAHHGSDYAFLVDDDPHAYPDPRSPWQPNGVHAASRIYDHSLFPWNTAQWNVPALADAVIYELHIGTFTTEGTFDAAIAHLPYLKDLGVTHVEVMPVASYPGQCGWGYDGVSLYAPQEYYGGPDGLKRFVDACHTTGLAAVLDVVYNHFGPSGNYTGVFGPYILHEHETPWGGVVNLDGEHSAQVRRYFIDNALMWLRDYRFDALRLDAIHALLDKSPVHFLAQLSTEVAELSRLLGRPLQFIAESDLNDPVVVTPRAQGGYGMDAQWSDDFHHALHAVLTGEQQGYYADFGSVAQLAKSLCSAYVYDGQLSPSRHRPHGQPASGLSSDRFLGYIQNHDQIGNRAQGERIHAIAGMDAARLAAALVLTSPFIPLIFQGEEFAASAPFLYFADHEEVELRRAVSEGRRKEFAGFAWGGEVPDPENPETFFRSRLPWNELDPADSANEHHAMLRWYRRLLQLRREEPALRDTDLAHVHTTFDETARWLVVQRGNIQIACNFSTAARSIPVSGQNEVLAASADGAVAGPASVQLPPLSAAILRSA